MEDQTKAILWAILITATIIIILFAIVIIMNPPKPIEVSGYIICDSQFHIRCEGVCKHLDEYVLHYRYTDGYCQFKLFSEEERDLMEEQLCFIR